MGWTLDRCRKRGILENDILLGNFAATHLPTLSDEAVGLLRRGFSKGVSLRRVRSAVERAVYVGSCQEARVLHYIPRVLH